MVLKWGTIILSFSRGVCNIEVNHKVMSCFHSFLPFQEQGGHGIFGSTGKGQTGSEKTW